jgi:hypothetical protein
VTPPEPTLSELTDEITDRRSNPRGWTIARGYIERERKAQGELEECQRKLELALSALEHLARPNWRVKPSAQDARNMAGFASRELAAICGDEPEPIASRRAELDDDTDPRSLESDEPPYGSFPEER